MTGAGGHDGKRGRAMKAGSERANWENEIQRQWEQALGMLEAAVESRDSALLAKLEAEAGEAEALAASGGARGAAYAEAAARHAEAVDRHIAAAERYVAEQVKQIGHLKEYAAAAAAFSQAHAREGEARAAAFALAKERARNLSRLGGLSAEIGKAEPGEKRGLLEKELAACEAKAEAIEGAVPGVRRDAGSLVEKLSAAAGEYDSVSKALGGKMAESKQALGEALDECLKTEAALTRATAGLVAARAALAAEAARPPDRGGEGKSPEPALLTDEGFRAYATTGLDENGLKVSEARRAAYAAEQMDTALARVADIYNVADMVGRPADLESLLESFDRMAAAERDARLAHASQGRPADAAAGQFADFTGTRPGAAAEPSPSDNLASYIKTGRFADGSEPSEERLRAAVGERNGSGRGRPVTVEDVKAAREARRAQGAAADGPAGKAERPAPAGSGAPKSPRRPSL